MSDGESGQKTFVGFQHWNRLCYGGRTVCVMEARCSDIVLIFKKNRETIIINVVIPGEFRVRNKEAEKISKYQDFALEICRTLNTKNRVIPKVIGALEAKSLFTEYLSTIGVKIRQGDSTQQTDIR